MERKTLSDRINLDWKFKVFCSWVMVRETIQIIICQCTLSNDIFNSTLVEASRWRVKFVFAFGIEKCHLKIWKNLKPRTKSQSKGIMHPEMRVDLFSFSFSYVSRGEKTGQYWDQRDFHWVVGVHQWGRIENCCSNTNENVTSSLHYFDLDSAHRQQKNYKQGFAFLSASHLVQVMV